MSGEKPPGRSNLVRALTTVLILIVGTGVVWVGLTVAMGTSNPLAVVYSGSMEPALQVGDIIIIHDGKTFHSVTVGTIIVFEQPKYGILVHRVAAIVNDDEGLGFITKGDHNSRVDSWVVREGDYIGSVVFVVPKIGYIAKLIQPPLNYVLIVIILLAVFVSEYYYSRKPQSVPKNVSQG